MFTQSPELAKFLANERYENLLDEVRIAKIARQSKVHSVNLIDRALSSLGSFLSNLGAAMKFRAERAERNVA